MFRKPAWSADQPPHPPPLPMAVHPLATLPRASPAMRTSPHVTLPEEIYESIYDTRWRLMNKVGWKEL